MADDKDIAAEGEGGGRKKLIIIIAVAVVLLLGAGGAAFFLLGGDDDVEGETAEQAPAVEETDPVYLKLDPEFIVNLPPGGQVRMLQVAIQVMTRNPTVAATLEANDPMIRHHLLNLLEQQDAQALFTVEGKQALQASIHELLNSKLKELNDPGQVQGVFFTQFVMQ